MIFSIMVRGLIGSKWQVAMSVMVLPSLILVLVSTAYTVYLSVPRVPLAGK